MYSRLAKDVCVGPLFEEMSMYWLDFLGEINKRFYEESYKKGISGMISFLLAIYGYFAEDSVRAQGAHYPYKRPHWRQYSYQWFASAPIWCDRLYICTLWLVISYDTLKKSSVHPKSPSSYLLMKFRNHWSWLHSDPLDNLVPRRNLKSPKSRSFITHASAVILSCAVINSITTGWLCNKLRTNEILQDSGLICVSDGYRLLRNPQGPLLLTWFNFNPSMYK